MFFAAAKRAQAAGACMIGSEADFLALIDRFFPNHGMLVGRGDDCAVFSCPEKMCVTSDLFIEDVHFRRRYFSPFDIGHKALAVNISDIAAMGAVPLGFSLSLAVPTGLDQSFWSGFFSGMSGLAQKHALFLSGGDLSRADKLAANITIWGDCSSGYRLRGHCREGDKIFLVGKIGLARTGLFLLESGMSSRGYSRAIEAHLRPLPQVEAGIQLAGLEGVMAMMDVSDGLARDFPRLLGPDMGVEIELDHADLDSEIVSWCSRTGENPLEFALLGGEDYALVAVVDKQAVVRLGDELGLQGRFIGTVCKKAGIFLQGVPLTCQGFDHFSYQ